MLLRSSKLLENVLIICTVMFLIVVTHEAGHVFVGKALGYDSTVNFVTGEDGLRYYGFATVFSEPIAKKDVSLVAVGGVLFNALTAVVAYVIFNRTKNLFLRDVLFVLIVASVASVFLNIIPIEPFDGSKIF